MYLLRRLPNRALCLWASLLFVPGLSACLQMNIESSRRVAASQPEDLEKTAAELLKNYPNDQERSMEAFRRSVYPVMRGACGSCHVTGGQAAGVPHSDSNLSLAHSTALGKSMFDFKDPSSSHVFHLHNHPKSMSEISGSPETAEAVWKRQIQRFAVLRGKVEDLPVTQADEIKQETRDILAQSNGGAVVRPSSTTWIDLRKLVQGWDSMPTFSLALQYSIALVDGDYEISNLKLKSDVTTFRLAIDSVDVYLNGNLVSNASGFRRRFEVDFPTAQSAVTITTTGERAVIPASAEEGAIDKISFRLNGMKWEEKSAPTPTPPPPMADYRNERRVAAMRVLQNRCNGCHGLVGPTGGAFPQATDLVNLATDQEWINAVTPNTRSKWIVAGSPQTSVLMQRLQVVANGGPVISTTLSKNMPQGRAPLTLAEVWAVYDWILLMNEPKTKSFAVQTGSIQRPWNTPTVPIRMKVGDVFFVRNLDSFEHRIHAGGRPFQHDPVATPGCAPTVECGSTRRNVTAPGNSIPMQGTDEIYEHNQDRNLTQLYMDVVQ